MTPKRILVVDDEIHIRAVLQACLEDLAGWQVLMASSGEECLNLAAIESLDAILLDVSMPGMDGIATVKTLKQHPIAHGIPVAFLTARVQPDDQAQFADLGISGVITKPFDPLTLIQEIEQTFGWSDRR